MRISFLPAEQPAWLKPALIWVGIVAGSALLLVGIGYGVALAYEYRYEGKIFPGVVADGMELGGLSVAEAEDRLADAVEQALATGLTFRYDETTVLVPITNATGTSLIQYDARAAVATAFQKGRTRSFFTNSVSRLGLRLRPSDVRIPVTINEQAVETILKERLRDQMTLAKDAVLNVSISSSKEPPTVLIEPEQIGSMQDLALVAAQLKAQADSLRFSTITLREIRIQPTQFAKNLEPLVSEVPAWLAHAPFTLTAEDKSWKITSSTLATWLSATSTPDGWKMALDPLRLKTTLDTLLKDVIKAPREGKLIMDGEKMKEFVAPIEGIAVEPQKTITAITEGWTVGSSTMAIALERVTPKITGDAERLGIKEILGIGHSNFSGSPTNRRRNIAIGASRVNGTLIAPGTEFSLLKTLGPIEREYGWLPELVIKDNRTIPELGGGLCQIGTTSFRAALSAGMPITERRAHSYRVRYYEPAGTDATIYDPAPDFQFLNDTGNWALFTTQIQGNELVFTIWGTKDGRLAEQTKPRIYNIVSPPPKKTIETLDLPPGTVKCTETAHAGADASFDYTVTYANGEVKKENFFSRYKPWQAVCLVGVSALTQPVSGVDQTGLNNPNL